MKVRQIKKRYYGVTVVALGKVWTKGLGDCFAFQSTTRKNSLNEKKVSK